MATPRPSKRRKQDPIEDRNAESPYPMVFFSPGLQPDVRFTVYENYHLHSVVLKLHSRFFPRFLNFPEKSHLPASEAFQFEYVSAENEEGWVLEPKTSYTYGLSCPLSLYDSPIFGWAGLMQEKSYDLIFAAKQLRHSGLFRECFVHIDGQDCVRNDPELMPLVSAAHIDLCRAILAANQELIIEPVHMPVDEDLLSRDGCTNGKPYRDLPATKNAQYYRELYTYMCERDPEISSQKDGDLSER
ncbi:uncharacterized protein PAC_13248 [Phialocephala subalpina]|uniref:BTB domain-containing protein n=1 Tax=Phialocephala subalpina TaxID=576137 RepID=A0A1L7XE94_9HELO|nr:uncharacterized protein PAC_13248 [Phialocephala subalpina]